MGCNPLKLMPLVGLLLLAACNHVQTTSGAAFMERFERAKALAAAPSSGAVTTADVLDRADGVPAAAMHGISADGTALIGVEQIRQAAALEPLLTLPARFGLARILNGQLTAIPPEEADLWLDLAERYENFGTFMPISPLITAMTVDDVTLADGSSPRMNGSVADVVNSIRLGSARQHADAVLVYEVGVRGGSSATPLALADLTIIGAAFLPTRRVTAEGVAQAVLIDVRNGYTYGSAGAARDLERLATTFGRNRNLDELRDQASLRVVEALVPEVDEMMFNLVGQLVAAQPR